MARAQGKKIKSKEESTQHGDAWEDPEVLAQQISKTEKFFTENKGLVSIVFAIVVVIVGGLIGWRYYNSSQENEAKSEMFQAVFYFEQDSLELALWGDGNALGLTDIARDYPSTKSGNLANFYAGSIYVRQGKWDLAKLYLSDFSSSDLVVQARAYSLLGDVAMEEGDFETAIDYYNEAADYKANKEFTPSYLMKLALAYEQAGDVDSAKDAYKKIIDEYWDSSEYQNARKHFARLGGVES